MLIKPFGGGYSMGGGGGGAGAGMLRQFSRVVVSRSSRTVGNGNTLNNVLQENCSGASSGNKNKLSAENTSLVSVASASPVNFSTCGVACPPPLLFEENEWVDVEELSDDEKGVLCCQGDDDDNLFLGKVPSLEEVENAVSAMKQVFDPAYCSPSIKDKFSCDAENNIADQYAPLSNALHKTPSTGSESDWLEPSHYLHNSRMLEQYGTAGVYDAFHLLETDPLVQKMVISLSSDKAVWDAVLNNEVVQEIKGSLTADNKNSPESSTDNPSELNAVIEALKWIFNNTKVKVTEVLKTLAKHVNNMFQLPGNEKMKPGAMDYFNKKLKTSFMLSVIVLLIVVVTRSHKL